jgi:hypothetical protein
MTIINITLANKAEICFKLLENDFVEEWFEHFKGKHKFSGKLEKFVPRFNNTNLRRKPYEEAIVDIHNTIRSLRDELEIDLPIVLETIDRQTLNQLHRFFTTMKTTDSTYDLNKPDLFNIQNNKYRFYGLLDDLNEAVHNAEQIYYSSNERLKGFEEYRYHVLKFLNRNLIKINNKHLKYMSRNHTVNLATNILGKSYFNCYYDYDDPRYFDIKNCQHYCCDLEFEFQQTNIFNMFNNKNYQQWLTDYKMPVNDQTCGLMPIGDLISYNFTNDGNKFNKVQKIEYA